MYILIIIICFLGYVLPWGQMSYWALVVITNLLSLLPYGYKIIYFLWGNLFIDNNSFNRVYILHFILPFILLILIYVHIAIVHFTVSLNKSNKKIAINSKSIITLFNLKYIVIKDLVLLIFIFIIYLYILCFKAYLFHNSINFIEANSLLTPKHIIPEWYLLPIYAIIKLIPNKIRGALLVLIILCYFCFCYFLKFRYNKHNLILLVFILLILLHIGLVQNTFIISYIINNYILLFAQGFYFISFLYIRYKFSKWFKSQFKINESKIVYKKRDLVALRFKKLKSSDI